MIFYPILSHQYFTNNIQRSIYIENQRLLAGYDDRLYQSFGILAYKKSTINEINIHIKKNMETFKSPLNLYQITQIEVDYETKGFEHHKILTQQILYFMKRKISQTLLKELAEHVSESKVALKKIEELKGKLSDIKGYDQIKTFQKKLLSHKKSFDDFEQGLNAFESMIENQQGLIEDLQRLKTLAESGSYQDSLVALKNSYEESLLSLQRKRELIQGIMSLEIELEAYQSKDTKELTKEEILLKEEVIKNLDIKKQKLIQLIEDEGKDKEIINGLKKLLKALAWDFPVLNEETFKNSILKEYEPLFLTANESLLLNEYILGTFMTCVESEYREYNFYNNHQSLKRLKGEVEFIIEGYAINQSVLKIGTKILAIREVMNLSHLLLDTEKRNFLLSTAQTPVYGLFVSAGLAVLWTTLESTIDLKKIYNGQGTPFMKISDKHFVVGLETLKNPKSLNILDNNEKVFVYYNDYLRMFLLPIDDSVKINRLSQVINHYMPINDFVIEHKISYKVTYQNKLTHKRYEKSFELVGNYYE